MIELVWFVSAAIVLVLAVGAILHPDIETGVVGTAFIGLAALCGAAGLDTVPPRWVVYATSSMAAAGLWAWWRWSRRRRHPS